MSLINILIASRYVVDQRRIMDALPEQMEFFITGIANDESGAIIKSECLKPDILILDLQLSEITGPELVRIVRRKSPSTAIIILQDKIFDQSVLDMFLFTNGISGFLLKESDIDKLAHIVKIIFLGGCYFNSSITVNIISSVTLINQFYDFAEFDNFSSVERSIVTLIARGFSDPQIAFELNLSIGTIRNSITIIRHKTNAKSRIDIVIYFLVTGFIRMEQLIMWNKNKYNDIINSGRSSENRSNNDEKI